MIDAEISVDGNAELLITSFPYDMSFAALRERLRTHKVLKKDFTLIIISSP